MEIDRIIASGDSFTEGAKNVINITSVETWPARLGNKLNVPWVNLAEGGSSNYDIALQPIQHIKDKPSNKLYCSLPDTYPPYPMEGVSDIVFGSGAGLFLSKDVVRLLIDKQNMVDSSLPNDVAYGKLFIHDHKITLTEGKRQDFRKFA